MATQPKLALIPSGYKDGKLYSVLPTDGVGDFDVTRGSNATRINKDGLIEIVSGNTPRLNYPLIDGVVSGCPSLLLEPSRTNLISYSEDFSQSAWTKFRLSVSANSITSPDGNSNTYEITEDSTNNSHVLRFSFTSLNTDYSFSFFVKSKSGDRYIELDLGYNANKSIFDIENGIIISDTTNNAKITSLDNNWYKISISDTVLLNENSYDIRLVDKSSGSGTYLGNGTSGVYIWGAQVEAGSYPTSIINTQGTVQTRFADTANNAGDASTFNDSEGVLMAEVSALANDGTFRLMTLSDGSNTNEILFGYRNGDNNIYLNVSGGSVFEIYQVPDITLSSKFAIKYKENDFSVHFNGFKVITDPSGTLPSNLSVLNLSRGDGSLPFYGNTKQVQYYDSALTDSELETLTSWNSFKDMAQSQLYSIK